MAKLTELHGEILAKLARATADPKSAWRTPVLATVTPEGAPAARTVILRHLDRTGQSLVFYTDNRSNKIDDLKQNSAVEICFWDPKSGQQLRVAGSGYVETDPDRLDQIWRDVPVGSRLVYRAAATPGQPIEIPGETSEDRRLERAETEHGRAHFRVLTVRWRKWDWLHLGQSGQRRARFIFEDDGGVDATWIGA